MSVVAVKKTKTTIEIAADSILLNGEQTKEKTGGVKLFSVNDVIVGGCGDFSEIVMMKIFLAESKPRTASEDGIINFLSLFADWKRKKTEEFSIDNEYIIIFKNKVFCIQQFCVLEVKKFTSIGAGADYALTALYLGETAKTACKIACELCAFCSLPIKSLVVDI